MMTLKITTNQNQNFRSAQLYNGSGLVKAVYNWKEVARVMETPVEVEFEVDFAAGMELLKNMGPTSL